jgi:MFS family permease
MVTLLFCAFAFCSFISSPFFRALLDRIGRRPILIISISGMALGWLVFASAHSLIFSSPGALLMVWQLAIFPRPKLSVDI